MNYGEKDIGIMVGECVDKVQFFLCIFIHSKFVLRVTCLRRFDDFNCVKTMFPVVIL